MKITVNGSVKEVDEVGNLDQLVTSLLEKTEGIIVELNEKIVNRNKWKEQPLREGDVLELIQFIGGG